MLVRLAAPLLVALVLLMPGAMAFSASEDEVTIRYDATAAPIVLAAGHIEATGAIHGGLLTAGLNNSRIGAIPQLTIASENGILNVTDATLIIHDGSLVWVLGNGTASLEAVAPYAFGVALQRAPFATDAEPYPGLILAGPSLLANVTWLSGELNLVPLDANVSILDASGRPIAGWDHRAMNANGTLQAANGQGAGTVLIAQGRFDAQLAPQAIAGGVEPKAKRMTLTVTPAQDDRFIDAVNAIGAMTRMFTGNQGEGGGADPGAALEQVGALSGILNGALLILDQGGIGGGQNATSPEPLESRLGDRDVESGPFILLRSKDLALAWGDQEMSVTGDSTLAVTQDGFNVKEPWAIGPIPILAIILWLGAIGAIVTFFLKAPPTSKGTWTLRLISIGVYVVVLLLVMWYWDASFADTFGTSVLTLIGKHGLTGVPFSQLMLVFGLESIPWTIAAIFFALPVRIMLGVALRYRGDGSSYKRIASAGGLVSLAIFGPIYALWIVNAIIKQVIAAMPNLMG